MSHLNLEERLGRQFVALIAILVTIVVSAGVTVFMLGWFANACGG